MNRFANQSNNKPTETVELESQYLIRLPLEPATALREALRSGASNISTRLQIQMAPDKDSTNNQLRRGHVTFDGWKMSAKLVDLPTILESQKTIDRKTFYKTADISQLLICKEGEPSDDDDPPTPTPKNKSKDPNKVDKKFIYNHGIVPPLKNCRKRRFRKVLKKKSVEAPEIEKEVKRLIRVDYEASHVTYDVITEDELAASRGGHAAPESAENSQQPPESKPTAAKVSKKSDKGANSAAPAAAAGDESLVGHDDLFGALSDSEDSDGDDEKKNIEVDSEGDSNAVSFPSSSIQSQSSSLPTQFSSSMFNKSGSSDLGADEAASGSGGGSGENAVAVKIETLKKEIATLKTSESELEKNIANCNNQAIKIRFEETLLQTRTDLVGKENELEGLSMFS